MFEFELPEKFRRYVPPAVWLIVGLVLLAVPLKIISYGYLPADDALRHCAKAVSGRPWPEILVVGGSFKLDHNYGWHAILGVVHHATGWGAENLVVFSVVALFLIANGMVLPWLRRPEAWLVALLAAMILSDLPQRFLLGRPFALTSAVLMTVLLVTRNHARPGWKHYALFTSLIAAATFVHGVWYLWLLPVGAFFFAGQFRWTGCLAGAWLSATALSALLTGHPADYLSQALSMAFDSLGQHSTNRTEVTEFRPFAGDILAVILVGALVALRRLVNPAAPSFGKTPAFWLMAGCWMLGFRVGRFWEDWGWPALMVLLVTEVEFLLLARQAVDSLRRLLLAIILAVAAFLAVTSDLNSRWTQSLTWAFLTPEVPELAGWMPQPGGILYSADMNVFYQTFFKNPNADWRYQLGYEPSLMPAADFATYQKILWNNGDAKAYAPWVAKMKPADRLVIHGTSAAPPNIPRLEWNYGVSGLWIGRTPRLPMKAAE